MKPLTRLFQLSLYTNVHFLPRTLEKLFSQPEPHSWREILELLDGDPFCRITSSQGWCSERWSCLDRWSEQHSLHWTYPGDANYPWRLQSLSIPPLILCYKGVPIWKNVELISVVGSREPTRDSLDWMRRHLLTMLENAEVGVASGGARGIDRAAHELSILAGRPTICFLPSGILRPYPGNHHSLFANIVESGGALISGFAPDAEMRKSYFHARNRWIAGISSVTCVIEAQRKSGSYLTAKMAMGEGRAICTLPVSPMAGRGLANLDLIFDGAYMLRDQADLLAYFASELRRS